MRYREANSHDILGTYKAILQSRQSPVIAGSADAFVSRLLIGLRLLKARCREEDCPLPCRQALSTNSCVYVSIP